MWSRLAINIFLLGLILPQYQRTLTGCLNNNFLMKWMPLCFWVLLTAAQSSLPKLYISIWIFNDSVFIDIHNPGEVKEANCEYTVLIRTGGRTASDFWLSKHNKSKLHGELLSSKRSDKGTAITLSLQQNSIIHMAFHSKSMCWRACDWQLLHSWLNFFFFFFLLCVCCTCALFLPPGSRYCPILQTVWHHQGQRLQQQ